MESIQAGDDLPEASIALVEFRSFLQCQLKKEAQVHLNQDLELPEAPAVRMWPGYEAYVDELSDWVPYHVVLSARQKFLVEHVHQCDHGWDELTRFRVMFLFHAHCMIDLFRTAQLPLLRMPDFWQQTECFLEDGGAMQKALARFSLRKRLELLQPQLHSEEVVKNGDDIDLTVVILQRTRTLLSLADSIFPVMRSRNDDVYQKFTRVRSLLWRVPGLGRSWLDMLSIAIDVAYPDLGFLLANPIVCNDATAALQALRPWRDPGDPHRMLSELRQNMENAPSGHFQKMLVQVERWIQEKFDGRLFLAQMSSDEDVVGITDMRIQLAAFWRFHSAGESSMDTIHPQEGEKKHDAFIDVSDGEGASESDLEITGACEPEDDEESYEREPGNGKIVCDDLLDDIIAAVPSASASRHPSDVTRREQELSSMPPATLEQFCCFLQCQLKKEAQALMNADIELDKQANDMWSDYETFVKPNMGNAERWVPYHTILGVHERFLVEAVHHSNHGWDEYQKFLAIFVFRAHCKADVFNAAQLPILKKKSFWRNPKAAFKPDGEMEQALLDYRLSTRKPLLTNCFRIIPQRVLEDDDENLVRSIILRTGRLLDAAEKAYEIVKDARIRVQRKFEEISATFQAVKGLGATWAKMLMCCIDMAYPEIGLLASRCDVGVGAIVPLRRLLPGGGHSDPYKALEQLQAIFNESGDASFSHFWSMLEAVEGKAQQEFSGYRLILEQMNTSRGKLTAATLQVQLCEFRQFRHALARKTYNLTCDESMKETAKPTAAKKDKAPGHSPEKQESKDAIEEPPRKRLRWANNLLCPGASDCD